MIGMIQVIGGRLCRFWRQHWGHERSRRRLLRPLYIQPLSMHVLELVNGGQQSMSSIECLMQVRRSLEPHYVFIYGVEISSPRLR